MSLINRIVKRYFTCLFFFSALLSLTTASLYAKHLYPEWVIHANVETERFFDDAANGFADADDPALWYNHKNPSQSLIIGTLKKGGLASFTLNGKLRQQIFPDANKIPTSRYNNVDVIHSVNINQHPLDIIITTDRGQDRLRFFHLSAKQRLMRNITATDVPMIFSTLETLPLQRSAYGLASYYEHQQQQLWAFVSQRKQNQLAILQIQPTTSGLLSYQVVKQIALPSQFTLSNGQQWAPCLSDDNEQPQIEGMVFDKHSKQLYAAQEQVGIWRVDPFGKQSPELIDRVASFGIPYSRIWNHDEEEYHCNLLQPLPKHRPLVADVEGLALFQQHQQRLLLASSQGNDRIVVYRLSHHAPYSVTPIATLKILGTDHKQVKHTDGLATFPYYLGKDFPYGVLIVHDGEAGEKSYLNDNQVRDATNFKLISWGQIQQKLIQ
ncbi:phytase [Zooshikella marina]|uniref:phytase n=1 Tax=Zooshikella ganghwensis TaxID=202772 RepID=UPI001BAED586|nr:phytase [Zooshikella ganghwensis]MBU2705313.1 phytase [Zooshikella ganghwensis]